MIQQDRETCRWSFSPYLTSETAFTFVSLNSSTENVEKIRKIKVKLGAYLGLKRL